VATCSPGLYYTYMWRGPVVDELFKALFTNGGLIGAFLAASLTVNGLLFKMLLSEKDKRIEDAKTILSGIATSLTFIKDSLELLDQKVRVSKKAERDEY
jgi:hypothetical protein